MSIPFIHRNPTLAETAKLRYAFSTFCDGSGMDDGGLMPGWRDYERSLPCVLGGSCLETKHVFDIVTPCNFKQDVVYGVSVKSHKMRKAVFESLKSTGRCHMELSNSSTAFWKLLSQKDISEENFRAKLFDQEVGKSLIETIKALRRNVVQEQAREGKILSLEESIYIAVSYTKIAGHNRKYIVHSFDMTFPDNIRWEYMSDKCLRGFDPDYPDEVLFDWYGVSGGQLKWYPRTNTCKFYSDFFTLCPPKVISISDKASNYWPKQWEMISS